MALSNTSLLLGILAVAILIMSSDVAAKKQITSQLFVKGNFTYFSTRIYINFLKCYLFVSKIKLMFTEINKYKNLNILFYRIINLIEKSKDHKYCLKKLNKKNFRDNNYLKNIFIKLVGTREIFRDVKIKLVKVI